jgi:hypothetical protein
MRIGIAADHGGFGLKEDLRSRLTAAGHEVVGFGANRLESGDSVGAGSDVRQSRARGCCLRKRCGGFRLRQQSSGSPRRSD